MPPKARPPPSSSSSSGSESGSAAASSDDEEQQQQQPPQETQPSPPSKKPLSNPKTPPASAAAAADSSSSDEDEEEDGSDENSDSPSGKPPPPEEPPAAAAKPPPSESESESGSDSSDSEAPPPPPPPRRASRGADPSIKPFASKPMDGGAAAKPKRAAVAASEVKVTPEKRKRTAAADAGEDPSVAASGKKLFQRVWTAEDEISVLEGMVAFLAKHGGAADPATAVDAFYEFIHRSLRVKFSKTQISDKMRRLRKKYETNLRRSKKGADPAFAKSHEQASFQLSKKIWAPRSRRRPRRPPTTGKKKAWFSPPAWPGTGSGAVAGGPHRNLREAINLLEKDSGTICRRDRYPGRSSFSSPAWPGPWTSAGASTSSPAPSSCWSGRSSRRTSSSPW
ncbi:unnamed protein product [Spirodela intermedia]|uniref:Glabrous enhancer-binding protein-like DBD domain-containing protein n=1 Tax=Spirodela intermedia TaxID=51605 RepID=A0A7I8ILM8_SPIIN|nr:unnamed protein product [Spirodela intermedia]CAA6658326.1 unnamed protein product [Spirodela intermedia]